MKVECIKAISSYVTKGKIYNVDEEKHEFEDMYCIHDDACDIEWYDKVEFEVVEEKPEVVEENNNRWNLLEI